MNQSENSSRGSALLTALAVITLAGILVTTMFNRSLRGLKHWDNERKSLQALYLAESGIAHQLMFQASSHRMIWDNRKRGAARTQM